jgi:hypothetical protein
VQFRSNLPACSSRCRSARRPPCFTANTRFTARFSRLPLRLRVFPCDSRDLTIARRMLEKAPASLAHRSALDGFGASVCGVFYGGQTSFTSIEKAAPGVGVKAPGAVVAGICHAPRPAQAPRTWEKEKPRATGNSGRSAPKRNRRSSPAVSAERHTHARVDPSTRKGWAAPGAFREPGAARCDGSTKPPQTH